MVARIIKLPTQRQRPAPPANLNRFEPATGVLEWIYRHILAEDGTIHNPEHAHLRGADLEILWAPGAFRKQGRTVVGTAEQVAFRVSGWQRGRAEQQLEDWFGRIPAWLITFDASYCSTCSDAEWCALVEHELYHVAQAEDEFGAPAFTKDGRPKLMLRGHDVEEFVGVVRRYGVGDPNGAIARLAAAARGPVEVNPVRVAGVCGTCVLRAA